MLIVSAYFCGSLASGLYCRRTASSVSCGPVSKSTRGRLLIWRRYQASRMGAANVTAALHNLAVLPDISVPVATPNATWRHQKPAVRSSAKAELPTGLFWPPNWVRDSAERLPQSLLQVLGCGANVMDSLQGVTLQLRGEHWSSSSSS